MRNVIALQFCWTASGFEDDNEFCFCNVLQPKSFFFAGTKDKRAVTTQQVSVALFLNYSVELIVFIFEVHAFV